MVRIMGIVLNVRCIMVLDRGTHSIQDSQDSANGHGGDEARRRWNGRLSPRPLACPKNKNIVPEKYLAFVRLTVRLTGWSLFVSCVRRIITRIRRTGLMSAAEAQWLSNPL